MRVVFLISPYYASAEFALNKLIKSATDDIEIVGIISSDINVFSKRYWKYLFYGIKRSGLFYGILIGLVIHLHFIGLFLASLIYWWRKRQWLTLNELVQNYDLKHFFTEDINSADTIETLKSWEPDIVISLYFDQILKAEAIQVARIATINMHAGTLPGYRGVWPEFWMLYKKEKQAGITIHYINEKIDEGDILDQYKFDIKETDSRFGLALRSAHYGTKRLLQVLKNFKDGIKMHPIKKKGKARYRSLPKKRHIEKFYQKGKRLINFMKDITKVIRLSQNLDEIDSNYKSKSSSSSSSSSSE
jgi:methionyl-tRNA formyltransferase